MAGSSFDKVLGRAAAHAGDWLAGVSERSIPARVTPDQMLEVFGGPLPDEGMAAEEVIDVLAEGAEPGLIAMQSGRFYGWVIGGTYPVALGADWLVSAWDQNNGMRATTPATAVLEQVAGEWIVDLLDLPPESVVGFVTGGTMANFSGLSAGRFDVLSRAGWDVNADGLQGAPKVHVLVGAERHDTVDISLRYLGLGAPTEVPADGQGRIRVDALAEALESIPRGEPVIVALQAGNVHSGAFDPFDDAIALAHQHGAWVHVDGAFGLWAAATPALVDLTRGMAAADSWSTDAHKTLNVPYDCGIVIARDERALLGAFDMHAAYLWSADAGPSHPYSYVPELSRRARGVPVWAAMRALGRSGVRELVDGLVARARAIAAGVAEIPGVRVVNDVVYTQVCMALPTDAETDAMGERLKRSGEVFMSPSDWAGRRVVRVSVSNATTDAEDVRRTVEAVRQAAEG
jgi:glutamate/tyrosine decarboxylase-like PLP-dependent enzyme